MSAYTDFAQPDLEKGPLPPNGTADKQRQRRHKNMKHGLHMHRRKRREADKLRKQMPGILAGGDGIDNAKLKRRLNIKNEIVAVVAEFCGTFLFLLFALNIATQAGQQELSSTTSTATAAAGAQGARLDTSQLLYSSLGFGFSLAVNAWVFFRVSGGLFNPAVTLGLYLSGALTWYRAITLAIVQFIAAIAAAGIAQLITPGGINAQTKLGAATSLAQGFFIEMFSTALLMFAIYMLAGEKHKATFLAPVGIGLALFLAEMFATGFTGGSLNPARSLGPDVIAASFESSCWIYYTAPFAGVLLSAGLYSLLKFSRYESANLGQDDDDTTMILKDAKGNVAGAVETIPAADMPAQLYRDRNQSMASLASVMSNTIPALAEGHGNAGHAETVTADPPRHSIS